MAVQPVMAGDIRTLWTLIQELAEHEHRLDQFRATEADWQATILGTHSRVEVILAWHGHKAVGYALFYLVFSTFCGQFALYLEDTYVNYPTAKAGGLPSPGKPGRASGPVDDGPPSRKTV